MCVKILAYNLGVQVATLKAILTPVGPSSAAATGNEQHEQQSFETKQPTTKKGCVLPY